MVVLLLGQLDVLTGLRKQKEKKEKKKKLILENFDLNGDRIQEELL